MNKLRWIGLSNDEVRLYRLEKLCLPLDEDLNIYEPIKIAIVDVETNGLDYKKNVIIELGILIVLVDKKTGILLQVISEYNHLNDPEMPLEKKIIQVTGIEDSDLKGHKIDWNLVNVILEEAEVITSFNAKFDRAFIDNMSTVSSSKAWACAYDQIPWQDQGFPEKSQKNLCFYHGYFYDAHRAINDVFALTHLLSHQSIHGDIYFKSLLEAYKNPIYLIVAKKTDFDKKSYFNQKSYQWHVELKLWYKYYETEAEGLNELEEIKPVYESSVFNAQMLLVDPKDRFKPIDILASSSNNSNALNKNALGKFTKEFVVLAENTAFNSKNILKKRGYDWFENDTKTKKFWYLFVTAEEGETEKSWLKEHVYEENIFSGRIMKNSYYKSKD